MFGQFPFGGGYFGDGPGLTTVVVGDQTIAMRALIGSDRTSQALTASADTGSDLVSSDEQTRAFTATKGDL